MVERFDEGGVSDLMAKEGIYNGCGQLCSS